MLLKGRKEKLVLLFATNNVNKYNEARQVLAQYRITVGMLRIKPAEIQSDSLEEIAKTSVLDAFERCHLPIVVEDAGLFVDALNGFPGPYAAYVYKTVGNEGLLRLMRGVEDRRAIFRSEIAYLSLDSELPLCFAGQTEGEIVERARKGSGNSGFGFDPIFKPSKVAETFAEMDLLEKNKYSHRARAFRQFAEWYTERAR